MRYLFTLIIILLSGYAKAQISLPLPRERALPPGAETINQYFKKIKKEDYVNLVPFRKIDRWGYVHKNTLQVMVPAIANSLVLYKGDEYGSSYLGFIIDSLDNYSLMIDNKGELHASPSVVDMAPFAPAIGGMYGRQFSPGIQVLSSQKGYAGFKYKVVDSIIQITAYSDLYRSGNNREPRLTPVKMNGKWYAIAGKKTKNPYVTHFGIIDSNGVALQHFEFIHHRIVAIRGMKDTFHTWFLVQTADAKEHNFSYLNDKGIYRLKDSLPYHVYDGLYAMKIYPYYQVSQDVLGYITVEDKVIDTYELSQVLQLPAGHKISSLDYSTADVTKTKSLQEQRADAHIYLRVAYESEEYYMDFNGKKYIPARP